MYVTFIKITIYLNVLVEEFRKRVRETYVPGDWDKKFSFLWRKVKNIFGFLSYCEIFF